jgi:hypothetical protein
MTAQALAPARRKFGDGIEQSALYDLLNRAYFFQAKQILQLSSFRKNRRRCVQDLLIVVGRSRP